MTRLVRWVVRILLLVVGLSVMWVGVYRWIDPPATLLMVRDRMRDTPVSYRPVPLVAISRQLPRAVIGAEDSRFCTHRGFDFAAMRAAYRRNKQGGRLRGGSTISQQTAMNVFLWPGRTWLRKGLEAWFTFLIEAMWGNARIMEVYLNVAETGIGTYGVEAGARRYFGHSADSLSETEAARMAAALPLPKRRPVLNPTGFTRRYGNTIRARIGVVRRDGLDACVSG
jgi:monofunctional biosynthetic peptidoglycan transglycosylase